MGASPTMWKVSFLLLLAFAFAWTEPALADRSLQQSWRRWSQQQQPLDGGAGAGAGSGAAAGQGGTAATGAGGAAGTGAATGAAGTGATTGAAGTGAATGAAPGVAGAGQAPGAAAGTSAAAAATGQGGAGRPRQQRIDWRNQLTQLTRGPVGRARGARRQRLVAHSPMSRAVANSIAAGNSNSAAQTLTTATNANPAAAAEGIVAGVAQSPAVGPGSAASTATANAVVDSVDRSPDNAGEVLAKGADLAVNNGYTEQYGNVMADAFGASKRRNAVPQMTNAVTEAIATGGENAEVAYGTAIGKAIAAGGDSKAAVAEATASAFCEGGSTAESWSNAFAVALAQNAQGCLVLNEAKALARARCGGGSFAADAQAEATSTVLGFCGMLPPGYTLPGSSFSSGSSGSSATSGK